jgi:hypothetical protein
MWRVLNRRTFGVLLLACVVSACDDEVTPTNPTPVDPTTESFTGTIAQNGASIHNFTVSAGGAVSATLKSIGTDNTLVVGLDLGNWNTTTSTCSIVLAKTDATANSAIQGTMTAAGTLCVRVYDVGNISGATPVPYTVEVVHP